MEELQRSLSTWQLHSRMWQGSDWHEHAPPNSFSKMTHIIFETWGDSTEARPTKNSTVLNDVCVVPAVLVELIVLLLFCCCGGCYVSSSRCLAFPVQRYRRKRQETVLLLLVSKGDTTQHQQHQPKSKMATKSQETRGASRTNDEPHNRNAHNESRGWDRWRPFTPGGYHEPAQCGIRPTCIILSLDPKTTPSSRFPASILETS